MRHLITGFLLLISLAVSSQNGEKNFIDQNYIEVTGKAEMNIVPDLIYLKIVLSEKDNKNKQSLEVIEKSMILKLTEVGVDVNKDLAVKDFESSLKSYFISKSEIFLTKEYQLIVHDTKTLQKIFIEFQKLGISGVTIDKLDHSKIEQLRKEVKINAIKAAKEKAESLTSAINQAIGRAIFVQELNIDYLPGMLTEAAGLAANQISNFSFGASEPEVGFEKINLQYSIVVRFELK